jgi:hypothetical protein
MEIIQNWTNQRIQLSQLAYLDKISRLADKKNLQHNTLIASLKLLLRKNLATLAEVNKY